MKTEVSDLINAYNDTAKVFEKLKLDELLKNAQELFHSQIAIVDKEQKITYGELYAQVVELAAKITCENQPIGIVARRSIQTVVQIFAMLQSGNYYIPIDPIYDCDDVVTLENYVEKLQAPK
ncbi:MAG: AMP-binding protein [Oceanobacillus sp.]|nr:AMP-binding protein [Oceanobacillus sp.]